jgi:hypothetical protein
MIKSRYGLLFSIAGAALAWWYRNRGSSRPATMHRGDTIYRNTPLPSEAEGLSGGPT